MRCPRCFYQNQTSSGMCENCGISCLPPQTTAVSFDVVRSIHPMPEEDDWELQFEMGKMIQEGFDEFYRLQFEGYRLMRPDEFLPEGDTNGSDDS